MYSLSLRSSTIRLGIFISSLVIATILIFQLVWLKKVYHFEQKEFNHSVVKAVRGLYEDLNMASYYSSHLNDLIENPEPNLYIARIALPVNEDSLSSYLQYELDDFSIFTDCQLGVYSTAAGKYIYTGVLSSPISKKKQEPLLPAVGAAYDHITLYFPNRRQYIVSQMNFWIITSAILLLLLILFAGSLYYFYKQKFLNETQKDFIHNFTHEFKTPVSVISLAADVLKNPGIIEKPDKLATYAGIVEYQSSYLHNQIEKLLKFAYTDSHHLHLEKEKVNVHELIEEAIKNLTPLINEKQVTTHFNLQAKQPVLLADKDYLVIVFMNLIDNAVKYAKNPVVTISTVNSADTIHFSVADNGIGIEKKELKNIFKKFFRVRNGETYTAKGFGLGLSFVKKIVDAHEGKIKVESSAGKGSIFTIELPIL